MKNFKVKTLRVRCINDPTPAIKEHGNEFLRRIVLGYGEPIPQVGEEYTAIAQKTLDGVGTCLLLEEFDWSEMGITMLWRSSHFETLGGTFEDGTSFEYRFLTTTIKLD